MKSSKEIAIHIEGLSKKYTLGKAKSNTLRGTLSHLFDFNRGRKEEFWALKDIDLSINKGEKIGIIGRNGAGKSTLLKILSRITYPSKGKATLYGEVTSLLEVGTGFHPELTGRENIFLNGSLLGMSKQDIRSKFDEIVDFSGVERFIDTPIKHYSSGMYVRLAFSVAAFLNSDILLVDEVLAVGDTEFQRKCINKMNDVTKSGRTVLFVSHQESAIRSLTSKVVLLNQGGIQQIGSPDEVYQNYNSFDHLDSVKKYTASSIVKSVKVTYVQQLEIEVEYAFDKENQMPHLGYVVTNQSGDRLFGGNPSVDHVKMNASYPKKGKVKIRVEQPALRNGKYYVSVYFGNGIEDIFVDEECVSFDVDGRSSNLGYLKATNKYEFL